MSTKNRLTIQKSHKDCIWLKSLSPYLTNAVNDKVVGLDLLGVFNYKTFIINEELLRFLGTHFVQQIDTVVVHLQHFM